MYRELLLATALTHEYHTSGNVQAGCERNVSFSVDSLNRLFDTGTAATNSCAEHSSLNVLGEIPAKKHFPFCSELASCVKSMSLP